MTKKRIGILTGGGDVPGLNSVIKSVVYRGAEIGCEIVQIAQHARVRKPKLGNVFRNQVEIAQARDAEQTQHNHEQQEKEEGDAEMKSDRARLPHG